MKYSFKFKFKQKKFITSIQKSQRVQVYEGNKDLI